VNTCLPLTRCFDLNEGRLTLCFLDYKLLLGELQLSFVLFLIGQIFDGLEQWKCLVQLVSASSKALEDMAGTLFYDFLGIFYINGVYSP
jgi:A1 cistron-splicing factor AAR2